jgi:hypothetical protein
MHYSSKSIFYFALFVVQKWLRKPHIDLAELHHLANDVLRSLTLELLPLRHSKGDISRGGGYKLEMHHTQ